MIIVLTIFFALYNQRKFDNTITQENLSEKLVTKTIDNELIILDDENINDYNTNSGENYYFNDEDEEKLRANELKKNNLEDYYKHSLLNNNLNGSNEINLKHQLKKSAFNSFIDYVKSFFKKTPPADDDITYSDAKNQECLISDEKLNSIYSDISGYNKLDKASKRRLKFIEGKCNPVLVVPGLMATRLSVSINCEEFLKEPGIKNDLFRYCSRFNVCPKNKKEKTYVLWPSVFTDFSLTKFEGWDTFDKKYTWNNDNSCMAYFMQYSNTPDSCPEVEGTNIRTCRYSKNVKIIPYGIDNNDYKKSENICGFSAINNILYSNVMSGILNKNSRVTQGFESITNNLLKVGYSRGYSLATAAYDFKESECDNKIFAEEFYNLIEMLYKNTNKKVIIIAHSYGNLNVNYQLNYHKNSEKLKSMVKHVVNIAGPLAGASKTEQILISGTNELQAVNALGGWIDITVSREIQSIMSPYFRSSYQLNNVDYYNELKKNPEYKELLDAIQERIEFEKCINSKQDNNQFLTENCNNFKKFESLFKDYMPIVFNQDVCRLNPSYKKNQEIIKKLSKNDSIETFPLYYSCHFGFYNYNTCPKFKFVENNLDVNIENEDKVNLMCDVSSKKEKDNAYYMCYDVNNKDKKCTQSLLSNKMNKINKYFPNSKRYVNDKYIDNYEKIINTNYNKCPKDFRNHNIDTTFVYSKSLQTRAAFFIKKESSSDLIEIPPKSNVVFSGGDGTVQSDGAIFPALKWIYDKKIGKANNNIRIFDYCSAVNKDFTYKNRKELNSKNYHFLNCECKDGENNYETDKFMNCDHANMLADSNVSNLLLDIIFELNDISNDQYSDKSKNIEIVKKEVGFFPKQCSNILKNVYSIK